MDGPDMHTSSFVFTDSGAEVEGFVQSYKSDGVKGCHAFLRSKQDEWRRLPLDIGIIGNSGSGKSTLINTIRGLTAEDDGAARTGVVETTMANDIKFYTHPNNEMLKFWDLPGVGTPNFPKNAYLVAIGFEKFDFFLIMSTGRFTENELWLGKEILKQRKQFYYVRSKIDVDVANHKRALKKTYQLTDPLTLIRDDILKNFETHCGSKINENKIFLIDGFERNKYDFQKLEQSLTNDFPALKRQALIFSMGAFTEQMVKQKVEELSKRIWGWSMLSAGIAIVPVPGLSAGVDFTIVLTESSFYIKTLGLDPDSLNRTANMMNVDVRNLQAIVDKSFPAKFLSIEGIKAIAMLIPEAASELVVEEFSRYIPIVGSVIAASLSFGLTYKILEYVLHKAEKVAIEVLNEVLETAAEEALELD